MKPRALVLLVLLASLVFTASCTLFETEVVEDETPYQEPALGHYLEFEDVQIPAGLRLDREDSFVYESEAVKAGVLTLTGDLSVPEVLAYFQESMPADGWSMLSGFRYKQNIIIYTKANKVCLLIAERPRNFSGMRMQVWVAPVKPGRSLNRESLPPDSSAGGSFSSGAASGASSFGSDAVTSQEPLSGQGPTEETLPLPNPQ